MGPLVNSWLVWVRTWDVILAIFGVFALGGGVAWLGLRCFLARRLSLGEYLALSAGGAIFSWFLGIGLVLLARFILRLEISWLWGCLAVWGLAGFVLYWAGWKDHLQPASDATQSPAARWLAIAPGLALLAFGVVSAYLRLGFIVDLAAPLYFDSAMHYSVISGLVANLETTTLPAFQEFVGGYYHLGFHFCVAVASLALGLDVNETLLVFGQVLLALLPLPVFFIVRRETQDDLAGFLAVGLAGWGWTMPAFALNWGKYPALASLLTFGGVLCGVYLMPLVRRQRRWVWLGVLGFCATVSTLIHSRSLVLIVIFLSSAALARAWRKWLPAWAQNLSLALVAGGIVVLLWLIRAKPVFTMLFDPYLLDGLWVLLLVLVLSPLAFKEFPVATVSLALALLFLLGSLFFSVTWFMRAYDVQTLLDQPLVEMFLPFPLALLGGLGYAGLARRLARLTMSWWLVPALGVGLLGLILVNAARYEYVPAGCCQFLGPDDATAIAWMDRQLSPAAYILIAASESFVFDAPTPSSSGADGGVWITPLIQRRTESLSFHTQFATADVHALLCQRQLTQVYVGGSFESFDVTQLRQRPEWYQPLLSLPQAEVYQIIGCSSAP